MYMKVGIGLQVLRLKDGIPRALKRRDRGTQSTQGASSSASAVFACIPLRLPKAGLRLIRSEAQVILSSHHDVSLACSSIVAKYK